MVEGWIVDFGLGIEFDVQNRKSTTYGSFSFYVSILHIDLKMTLHPPTLHQLIIY
jgi:hypothetical protein